MSTQQTVAPLYQPITLDQVKAHLRLDGSADDALLADVYIPAAVQACQQLIGRSIMAQQWRRTLDSFCDRMALPWPVVQRVESIEYWDTAGAVQTLAADVYELIDGAVYRAVGAEWPALWPGPGVVRISYTAGYAEGTEAQQQGAVPASIKSWLLLAVSTLYDRRNLGEDRPVSELLPVFVNGLLDPHKVY